MIQLSRIMLYVQDVERLSEFYRQAFPFPLVRHIAGEWAVLKVELIGPLCGGRDPEGNVFQIAEAV